MIVATAGHDTTSSSTAGALLERARRQHGRPIGIVKQTVLPADVENVGVARDDPERIAFIMARDAERVVGAQPAIGVVDAVVGVGARIDQRRNDVGGNVEIFLLHLSFNPEKTLDESLLQRTKDAMHCNSRPQLGRSDDVARFSRSID